MDDDITFGASVWTVPDNLLPTKQRTPSSSPALSTQDGFDDFDNFGTPAETLAASEDEADDDFGDFGDFGDDQGAPVTPGFTSGFNEDVGYAEDVWISGPSKGWRPLRLNPMPSTEDLQEQVDNILGPLWAHDNVSHLTDEEIRQVGGLNQTLVTAERL
ncbi:hypothetical protein A0H81_03955 [Grifola frondosa]|uniref:Uncharacterized protein n=1 Tax=Grifola frondosa TaxID=5627 RepID=A0A1C7MJ29_GRIFR|nr:hypothetical protein A0H81_03955 [Grifola frondosa]